MPVSLRLFTVVIALLLSFIPQSAWAYIGPGLSVGAMIVIFIVLISIALAFYAIVWFPLKRRLKAKKDLSAEQESTKDI